MQYDEGKGKTQKSNLYCELKVSGNAKTVKCTAHDKRVPQITAPLLAKRGPMTAQ